ncbi:hypothetical protein L596_019578 [Steinernema carpocapsae]|uniref:Protein kinase domain-containing protein n=1 Tax=Steinernema carpocapsae TaxID=34508 RepID=A0A4U5MRF9_STECR|nr:hypothetical protein L596_019578 [Steinernema carpocapsae]
MSSTDRCPVRWVAPEVFLTQQFRSSADVWAFGVLVWEIFNNGMEPYSTWALPDIKQNIIYKNYRLPFPEWTPTALSELITQKVWQGDPNLRIASGLAAKEIERLCPARAKTKMRGIPNLADRKKRMQEMSESELKNSSQDPGKSGKTIKHKDAISTKSRKGDQKSKMMSKQECKKDASIKQTKSKSKEPKRSKEDRRRNSAKPGGLNSSHEAKDRNSKRAVKKPH